VLTFTNPSPGLSDTFGAAVSISGTRLIVGAFQDDTAGDQSGRTYAYDLGGTSPTLPVFTWGYPAAPAGDLFGSSVAISGTRVVVGGYLDDTGASNAGRVHIYDLVNATNPSRASADWFGFAVAISENRIVVGAHQDDTGAANAGIAYVYDLAGGTPIVPVLTLTNPSPAPGDFFGYSVSISGTRVVIGAPFDDAGAVNAGSAYVYDLSTATPAVPWVTLTNPGPAVADLFGSSVSISGTRLVVGVPSDDTGAVNAGSAYVYDLVASTPTAPVKTLNNPSPGFDDRFGYCVAISGTRVAVGCPRADFSATDSGRAYLYDLNSAVPSIPAFTLTNPSPAASNLFGASVALSGTRLVVGVPMGNSGATNSGFAYIYNLAGGTPVVPIDILNNPSPASGDNFGTSVAIDATIVIAGAPFDDTSGQDRGAAYVFGSPLTLKAVSASPGSVTISWSPADAPGFLLQYTESLEPANWVNALDNATNPATVATTNTARFYRLTQQ
jgi:hypothetical protein